MTYATVQTPTLAELKAELAALQADFAEITDEPQTEAEFDAMCSECIGMNEIEGELMLRIAAKEAEIENLRTQIKNMPNETLISKAEAIGMLETQAVYARMNDGSKKQVGAIAWTKWVEAQSNVVRLLIDVRHLFVQN